MDKHLKAEVDEITDSWYSSEAYNRLEFGCFNMLNMLDITENQRGALEVFIGMALDVSYECGLRKGMTQIIESDLDFGE